MSLSSIFRKTSDNPSRSLVSEVVWAASLLFLVLGSWYLSGAESAIVSVLSIFAYGFLFYVVRIAYSLFFKKEVPKVSAFARAYVAKVWTVVLLVVLSVSAFAVYQNEIDPAKLPEYVISNGEKTVRFRAMSHIASESFYSGVKSDIASARAQGFVLFYEGVRPGTPENSKKFNALMGFKFDKNLYSAMSKLYGLVPQNQADIAWTADPRDRNVDVSIDDIIASYEKRKPAVSSEPSSQTGALEDVTSDITKIMTEEADRLNPRELAAVRYLNRAIMSLVIKNRDAGEAAFAGIGKVDLFSSILDDRNAVLAEALATTEEKKVFVTYGLLHFDGVFRILQERDPRWKISWPITNRYPTLP